MKYNPKTKSIEISLEKVDHAANLLKYALKNIRLQAGLPLDKYRQEGGLTNADYAMKSILDAAKALGIEMEAEWGEQLDLREI